MPSPTIATRTKGRRCVACNQPADAWLCSGCAFNSMYYSARFNDDTKPTSPTHVGKRNLYPGPTCYRDVPLLPALNERERMDVIRQRIEVRRDITTRAQRLTLLQELKAEVKRYDALARYVDANTQRRMRTPSALPPAHWNYVVPLDRRRWCDDCVCGRVHRADCPLIELEGRFVGGYLDDGIRPRGPKRFAKLTTPGAHWHPLHHKQHARAIARRWRAFRDMWTSIGLDYLTRTLEAAGGALRPPRAPPRRPPEKPKKKKGRTRTKSPLFALPVTPAPRPTVSADSVRSWRDLTGIVHAFVPHDAPWTVCREVRGSRMWDSSGSVIAVDAFQPRFITCVNCLAGIK